MFNESAFTELLNEAVRALDRGFAHLPATSAVYDRERLRAVLREAGERLRDNFPYHHPLYIGQMLKPPHPVAHLAYVLAMHLNPNNHALDGGRASSAMEKEAVGQIARMFGCETHLGHLTGGGTVANLEALWIARELHPGKSIAASAQAHYTHPRLCGVLEIPCHSVQVDAQGRMDVNALREPLAAGAIGTVVATLGTTASGAVDPLPEVLDLCRRHGVRVHVDAAYGGYFTLAGNLAAEARAAFDALAGADSIVVDPHKHGLQPYGCGCVLFADPSIGRFYRHDSPYTYFTSAELHLGEISLECSRPGAAAVALWTTMRLLPLERGGEFARSLESCRAAALSLHAGVSADARLAPLFEPELDIVLWAVRAETAGESSRLAREMFDAAAARDLHLALARIPRVMLEACSPIREWDADEITCLRACAMKSEHHEWIPPILARLRAAADAVLGPASVGNANPAGGG
jgi:tyrosine decarboxylase / aspartate 1-decarboxylase